MATSQAIIVDYQAGNVESVQRACHAVGIDALISADPDLIRKAERVIFPGVGTAESAVGTLHKTGIWDALLDFADAGRPLLGICLGAQILMEQTEEGDQACLGLIPGQCSQFRFEDVALKVPQIGWNAVRFERDHPLLHDIPTGLEFYFVHSYYLSLIHI